MMPAMEDPATVREMRLNDTIRDLETRLALLEKHVVTLARATARLMLFDPKTPAARSAAYVSHHALEMNVRDIAKIAPPPRVSP